MLSQCSSLRSESTTPFAKLIKVTGLGTQLPGHKLTHPASQLHNVRSSMGSGTAQHPPDSKFTPYSSVSQWLARVLIPYRAQALGRCSQEQLPCSSLTIHAYTQQQNLSICISLCYPQKGWVSTEALCSTENIKLKSA